MLFLFFYNMHRFFLFLVITIPFCSIAQITINTQNPAYSLSCGLDSVKMENIRSSEETPEKKEKMMRAYLQPFCDNNDALACYILATTYDKFDIGMGTKADADIAAKYYKKAADGKLADACYFLYQMYRYQFMNQPVNDSLSLHYLAEAAKYGTASVRAQCLRELAGIYYPRKENHNQSDMKGVKANLDSTKYFLSESLKIDSNDTWTLDFIASIYEDEKNYSRAFAFYIRSSNENSLLKVANWLATGKKIKKDTAQAVHIVKRVLDTLVKENGYTPQTIYSYMGSYNPAVLLNVFYTCYKIISRNEVGQWYSNTISCDDFAGTANE